MKRTWASSEYATLIQMKKDGCSWEEIQAALPNRSKGGDRSALFDEA